MQPQIVFPADFADVAYRIHGVGRRCAYGRAYKAGLEPLRAVSLDLLRERIGKHRELLVYGDQPQIIGANTGDHRGLFEGGVSLS